MIEIITGIVFAAALTLVVLRLYVRAPANAAFIRTGLFGKKVVIDGGAVVWPSVQSILWISLETFKLEVLKSQKQAFITKDRMRVDIGAEFYVKVEARKEAVERAARSLGERSFAAEDIQNLVEEKLVSALRSVAATQELMQMHENRVELARAVNEVLREPLLLNGLVLDDVSIFHLDQTERAHLDPGNIFDAEGLRQIAMQTSERSKQRNEIERNTEVAIKRKDVEAVKLKLNLDQEREFAVAEQVKQVETYRAQRGAETEQFKFDQERLTRVAEIEKERVVREAQIKEERAVREAEIRREAHLVQEALGKERVEIDKERALEEHRRDKEIAVLRKEQARLLEEEKRYKVEAQKTEAAQGVETVAQRAEAERVRQIALIQALRELEVAHKQAEATERLAQARLKDGEVSALVQQKHRQADNVLDPKIIERDIVLSLIQHSPSIAKELMAPAQRIESIKVLDINGLGAAGGAPADGSLPIDGIVSSILRAGAALPLLRELLDRAERTGEIGSAARRIADMVPGIKRAVGKDRDDNAGGNEGGQR